jgi:hypothetical protein
LELERKANLRKKKEGLADKAAPPPPPPGTPVAEALAPAAVAEDPKKAAIAAALKRAAEKKAALASQGLAPKNTENLAPAQQRQVEAAEVRRRELQPAEDAARPRE